MTRPKGFEVGCLGEKGWLKRIQKLSDADGDVDGESKRDPDPDLSGRYQTMTKTFKRLKTTERQKGDVF